MPQASSGKPLRFWLLLIGLIALACVAGLVALSLHRQSGAMVQITQDGQVVGTYSLQQPRTLRYESQDGGYNIVVIADGKVRVSEASCPDQVCVRTGPQTKPLPPSPAFPTAWSSRSLTMGRRPSWTECRNEYQKTHHHGHAHGHLHDRLSH